MTYIQRSLKVFLVVGLVAIIFLSTAAQTQNRGPIIIRDAEIESTFKEWMTPLLKVAGMGPNNVNLILVQSPQKNAFVTGGANIFIYTGLINATDGSEEIIGVLAHELGHIEGGHLIGARDALKRASYESILGTVIGIGAAIATGNGAAANAIIAGSNSVAGRRFLAHTRVAESSADQAALRYLEGAEINPKGLESFLKKLESEELLPSNQQSEYVRTHPLTQNRIQALQNKMQKSVHTDKPLPASWIEQHARMKAKLLGFIDPGRVAWTYNDLDKSVPARYARAIAAYRQNDPKKSLTEMDALLQAEPGNPYFHELKGQMLVDFGRVAEALPHYKKATDAAPNAGLIRIDYAHALLEANQSLQTAIQNLERAMVNEPRSARAHRLLATAYGRSGKEYMAKYHLAEEAALQRKYSYAKAQANMALSGFKEGSREWIKTRDLLTYLENKEADKR